MMTMIMQEKVESTTSISASCFIPKGTTQFCTPTWVFTPPFNFGVALTTQQLQSDEHHHMLLTHVKATNRSCPCFLHSPPKHPVEVTVTEYSGKQQNMCLPQSSTTQYLGRNHRHDHQHRRNPHVPCMIFQTTNSKAHPVVLYCTVGR